MVLKENTRAYKLTIDASIIVRASELKRITKRIKKIITNADYSKRGVVNLEITEW